MKELAAAPLHNVVESTAVGSILRSIRINCKDLTEIECKTASLPIYCNFRIVSI